jgi:hypothetical protein
MPSSINGIGTGIVTASKKRTVDGHIQFDAIQAVVFLFLPLVPYKAIHVLSIRQSGGEGQQYQSIDLRPSFRVIFKAFLNGWGNVLLFAGGVGLPLIGLAFATMARPMNQSDWTFLTIVIVVLALGVVAKLLWFVIDARDQRIRAIMGPHELGTSDPFDWTDETAATAREGILKQQELPTLIDVAAKFHNEGDSAGAMFYVRLAMRCEPGPEVDALFAQILAG